MSGVERSKSSICPVSSLDGDLYWGKGIGHPPEDGELASNADAAGYTTHPRRRLSERNVNVIGVQIKSRLNYAPWTWSGKPTETMRFSKKADRMTRGIFNIGADVSDAAASPSAHNTRSRIIQIPVNAVNASRSFIL